jgi:tetratricopeptide (TPR) repeat protein
MKVGKLSIVHLIIISAFVMAFNFTAYGQGNSISGFVFGLNRQPLENIEVELLDDLNRSSERQRTTASGFFSFNRLAAGRFNVRVLPFGTDYEEQIKSVEIVNISRTTSQAGGMTTGGFANEQVDFNLKLRKGATGATGAVFVQQVPAEAKKLYEKAVADLKDKKEKEGLQGLKAALEIFPDYFVALERLGKEYIQKGAAGKQYYEAAQILLTKAVLINPRGYDSWYGLAYSLYSLNKYDEASAAIKKAIEIYPTWSEALLLSGVLLRQDKKFEEAEKAFIKAKENARVAIPDIHWQLALLYGNDMKRYADAAKELKLFLKAQPDSKNAEQIKKLIADFEAKAQKS